MNLISSITHLLAITLSIIAFFISSFKFPRVKKIKKLAGFFIFLLVSIDVFSFKFDYNPLDLAKLAKSNINDIGLNCASPHNFQRNYQQFIAEFKHLLKGVASLSTELAIQTATKPNYPNLCHILTRSHLNTYKDNIIKENQVRCLVKIGSKCLQSQPVEAEIIRPSYYWPMFFVESYSNDKHGNSAFVDGNILYKVNRSISDKLSSIANESQYDYFFTFILGNSLISNPDPLALPLVYQPIQKQRMGTGNGFKSPSFDSAIWPISLSYTIAKNFTVCGPEREEIGLRAGGLKPILPEVSLTCPTASSLDIYKIWDNGVTDILDPVQLAKGMSVSNPATCLANYGAMSTYESAKEIAQELYVGMQEKVKKYSSSTSYKNALLGCSFPMLSPVETITSRVDAFKKISPLKTSDCTPWGNTIPRVSSQVFLTSYSYALAALRFRLLSSEYFGIPIGVSERWTPAYPWGMGSHKLYGVGNPLLIDTDLKNPQTLKHLALTKTKGLSKLTAYNTVDNLSLVSETTSRYSNSDIVSNSDSRVYSVWEKISCNRPSTKITYSAGPLKGTSIYEDCRTAVRHSVYKAFQTQVLRPLCDSAGQFLGSPFLIQK